MAATTPFQANTGAGGTIGAGITVTLNSGAASSVPGTIVGGGNSLMVTNTSGTATIFFRVTNQLSPQPAATAADCPVLPLNRLIVTTPYQLGGTLYVAAIANEALGVNTAVYFTPGEGGLDG